MKGKMEIIKEYIETCPLLDGGKINVDYLKDDLFSYSIDRTPTTKEVYSYVFGGGKKQLAFDFSITAPLSSQAIINLENSKFCDDFTEWVEEQNRKKNLPKIKGISSLKVTSDGYILQKTDTTAIYTIQLNLTYYELD